MNDTLSALEGDAAMPDCDKSHHRRRVSVCVCKCLCVVGGSADYVIRILTIKQQAHIN